MIQGLSIAIHIRNHYHFSSFFSEWCLVGSFQLSSSPPGSNFSYANANTTQSTKCSRFIFLERGPRLWPIQPLTSDPHNRAIFLPPLPCDCRKWNREQSARPSCLIKKGQQRNDRDVSRLAVLRLAGFCLVCDPLLLPDSD